LLLYGFAQVQLAALLSDGKVVELETYAEENGVSSLVFDSGSRMLLAPDPWNWHLSLTEAYRPRIADFVDALFVRLC
jgi:hypothetical protein